MPFNLPLPTKTLNHNNNVLPQQQQQQQHQHQQQNHNVPGTSNSVPQHQHKQGTSKRGHDSQMTELLGQQLQRLLQSSLEQKVTNPAHRTAWPLNHELQRPPLSRTLQTLLQQQITKRNQQELTSRLNNEGMGQYLRNLAYLNNQRQAYLRQAVPRLAYSGPPHQVTTPFSCIGQQRQDAPRFSISGAIDQEKPRFPCSVPHQQGVGNFSCGAQPRQGTPQFPFSKPNLQMLPATSFHEPQTRRAGYTLNQQRQQQLAAAAAAAAAAPILTQNQNLPFSDYQQRLLNTVVSRAQGSDKPRRDELMDREIVTHPSFPKRQYPNPPAVPPAVPSVVPSVVRQLRNNYHCREYRKRIKKGISNNQVLVTKFEEEAVELRKEMRELGRSREEIVRQIKRLCDLNPESLSNPVFEVAIAYLNRSQSLGASSSK